MTLVGENKARISYLPDLNNYEKDVFAEEDEEDLGPEEVTPGWDVFKHFPPKLKTGSKADTSFFDKALKWVKFLTYIFLFILVLFGGIITKEATLFATAQLNEKQGISYCDYNDAEQRPSGRKLSANVPLESRLIWYWCIFFAFAVPEVQSLLSSIYDCLVKKRNYPKKWDLAFLLVTEGLHAVGLALLFFFVLPQLNSVEALVVASCTSLVPGFLGAISPMNTAGPKGRSLLVVVGDVAAFAGQIFGILIWLIPDDSKEEDDTEVSSKWVIPVALVLTSCRWWANYVSSYSKIGFVRLLSRMRDRLQANRGSTMGWTAIARLLVFFASFIAIAYAKGIEPSQLFDGSVFTGEHNVTLHEPTPSSYANPEIGLVENATLQDERVGYRTLDNYYLPLIVFLVQVLAAIITYNSVKFACRTLMQGVGFALPVSLVLPGSLATLTTLTAIRDRETCVFHGFLPDHMFFETPKDIDSLLDFLSHWYPWVWIVSLLSQAWITRHIWSPHSERLATTARIFVVHTYDSLILDQSVVLNRKINQDYTSDDPAAQKLRSDEEAIDEPPYSNRSLEESKFMGEDKSDRVTRIIACATMWHETKEEMVEFVGSILRLDTDQGSKRFMQGFYNIEMRDYYELETHVFFDDAFQCMYGCERRCKHDENETRVNDHVMCLIDTIKEQVERRHIKAVPPMKYPAPYGGRLEWTLPGKTPLVVHLKDKNKIRHRKRWSQVMYMYYLLGYRLMDRPISSKKKIAIAENTYLLTLDGDIDFKPSAVKVLVDLMKRDRALGAACGRIHPIGTGPMVWFQKFEYAIGHWLQKSTEHTIGSVLCSPGCFSLFRARALMEHNVMRKYATPATQPRHYVQYDQGEDRWLCTLILQVGCRVEYSAASDSYTHAPETFNEFYNQRRRWIPSTVANIFDLLGTADETRKLNDDITWSFIVYQWVLMGSTVLGPGTIFLMLVGAFVTAFRIDNWTSFGYNLIPIAIFVLVCVACNAKIQLTVAAIVSAVYGLVMIIVLVGIMIQIAEDGWVAPSTILFFVVAGQIVMAGLLHPQEWSCLFCGLVYYATVPSMYMLLIIFSLFNVNNVTWGTRDSKPAGAEEEETEEGAEPGEKQNEKAKTVARKTKERGNFECSLAGLFKCMLCTQDTTKDEDRKFETLSESLNRIGSRLDAMEKNAPSNEGASIQRGEKLAGRPNDQESVDPVAKPVGPSEPEEYLDGSDEEEEDDFEDDTAPASDIYANGSTRDLSNFLVSPYWLQDERLRKGGVEFLTREEEAFWETLIEKYLHPIDEDKKQIAETAQGLKDLRDEYLFKFFMINAIFVLIIFMMQLQKDVLYLEWPLGTTYNITFVSTDTDMQVHLTKDYLKLEPMGCLFIATFVVILAIQFIAMLFHRCDTFIHVLANTSIDWCSCNKPADPNEQENLERHAEEVADGLQRVVECNAMPSLARKWSHLPPERRNTVHELADSQEKPDKLPASIDALFKKNLKDPKSEMSRLMSTRVPRRVFEALQRRSSTMLASPTQSEIRPYETDNIYHSPNNISGRNGGLSVNTDDSYTYENRAFSSDEYNQELPGANVTSPHQSSRVKFGNRNP